MVSCLESEGDLDRIIKIREQVKKQVASAKEKSNFAANGRQLLNIIDGALAFRRKNVTRAREIYEDLYDNATFTLSRITAPTSTPPLSQMRSCMSIAPRLTKPPGAGLTLSCRSLQGARELPKHSKLPTP